MPGDHAEDLGHTELFDGLSPDALASLAAGAHTRSYERGAVVFQRGDPGTGLCLVLNGRIKITVESADGAQMLLATLKPPDTFGELALIDGRPRSATAEAMEPAELLWISRDAFRDAYREHPQILENLLQMLGNLVRRITDQAAELALLDLEGRIAGVLVRMLEQEGGDARELDLGLTQSELASMVGASRQSVNQVLHGLERAGYVDLQGRRLEIRQPAALKARARF